VNRDADGDTKDNIPTPTKCNKINTSSDVDDKYRTGNIITVGYTIASRGKAFHIRGLSSRDGGPEIVNLWAIGNIENCPSNAGTKTQEGTSFAAPQVAGMAAYMLSLREIDDLTGATSGDRANKMRKLLSDLSYQRPPPMKHPEIKPEIWNGIVTI
jgi:subtilisin family serine protease